MRIAKFVGASLLAMAVATPAWSQEAPQSDDQADNGDIIVTATLRSELLQDVPLAVTAVSGESLEQAGVRDLRSFETVAASFNTNSTQTETGGTTLRIRGVGTTGNNTGLESAVGIFLDGVYLSRPGIALGDLLDVEQIELLRGPQGTLFGRNTSAGAINIRTSRPNLNEFEGFANASYGNYDLVSLQGGISVPLAEGTAGFRLSAAYRNRDGFLINAAGQDSNDRNRYLIRGQFYYEPTDTFNLRIIGDYSKSNEHCCDAVVVRESSYATAGLFAVSGLPANGGVTFSGPGTVGSLRSNSDAQFRDGIEQWGVSAEARLRFGDAELTYIAGYRHSRAESTQESDFVGLPVFSTSNDGSTSVAGSNNSFTRINTLTQELRLAGIAFNDSVDYLFGAYYSSERIREIQSLTMGPAHQAYISAALTSVGVPGPNPALNIFAGGVSSAGNFANNLFRQNGTNWSLFTNNTIHLNDAFAINFGLRYSDDSKDGSFDQLSANSPACSAVRARAGLLPATLQPLAPLAIALTCFPFATQVNTGAGTPLEFDNNFSDNELIYTGKLLFEPASNVNMYLSFTHGYKSGGFNLDPTAAANGADPRFQSETVNAYEFGIKTQWLDNRLTANLAVFRQDFSNFQVLEFTGVQFQTFNVGGARAEGFELETTLRPTRGLIFNASVTYSDANYDDDCDGGVFNVVVSPLCGQSLTNAADWTVVAGFDWTHPLGNTLEFNLNGNVRLESDRRVSTQALLQVATGTGNISLPNFPGGATNNYVLIPEGIEDSNAKVNLRAAIGAQDQSWRLEFWAVNLFDVRTRNVTFSVPLRGVGTLPGPLNAGGIGVARGSFLQEPRTYGVTLRGRF